MSDSPGGVNHISGTFRSKVELDWHCLQESLPFYVTWTSLQYGDSGLTEHFTWQLKIQEYMCQQTAWPFITYHSSHRALHIHNLLSEAVTHMSIFKGRACLHPSVGGMSKNLLPCFITIISSLPNYLSFLLYKY